MKLTLLCIVSIKCKVVLWGFVCLFVSVLLGIFFSQKVILLRLWNCVSADQENRFKENFLSCMSF